MANVELKNISKEYDLRTMGLTDVSLDFADGSLTTVVGAAGCGKTTLLFCIGGLVDITAGDLLIGGARMNDALPRDRNVCLMREGQTACHGSVADNIAFGLKLRGLPRVEIEKRTREAAAALGMTDILGANIKKLTEPDRRRVSLARGLARRPSVFLLDEPLFDLSEADRLALAADIEAAHAASGLTFIVATSCGADAFLFGGRVAVLKEGRVVCTGDETSLTEAPPDMFTAALLGENPMSFFKRNGETLGVRRGDLEISSVGEIEGEVIAVTPGALMVKPDADSPAVPVATDRDFPAGARIRLKLLRAARFDEERRFIGHIR